jgi:HSP20 family protein
MESLDQAMKDVCQLHEHMTQSPAPEVGPQSFVPFPAGVDPVSYAIQEVAQLKKMWQSRAQLSDSQVTWVPRASVFTGDSTFCYLVEVPGVSRDEVSVTVGAGELLVRGQRRPPEVEGHLRPVAVEQAWGKFERRLPVPAWCSPDQIQARYSQGILEITLSRPQEGAAGEVQVEVE